MRLAGKIAIVTGGALGIGRATAELFAEQGATVIVGDVQEPASYQAQGILWKRLDVSSADAWKEVVAEVEADFGRLDILVNNAGIQGPYDGIVELEFEGWERVLATNQTGVFLGMKYAVPAMMRSGGGSIVNMSSIWGIVGTPGCAAYSASKGAVTNMTKNVAITYAKDGIRVNSVHPATTATPLVMAQAAEFTDSYLARTPIQRMADPREVAYAVLFLASDEASFITGVELPVDGGYTAQ